MHDKRESYHTIPVIEVVEQVQFVPQFKTSSFRDDAVIPIIELCSPKWPGHTHDGCRKKVVKQNSS